jgi:hypothetical protein
MLCYPVLYPEILHHVTLIRVCHHFFPPNAIQGATNLVINSECMSQSFTYNDFHRSKIHVIVGPNGNIYDERWSEVRPRGGKELDVRVVAHSTVYHARTNSLLVYGGIVAGIARFSKLSDRMFSFQLDSRHWTEIHYPCSHLQDMHVPRERAFHTSTIIGMY